MALLLADEERIQAYGQTFGSIRRDQNGDCWAMGPDDDSWIAVDSRHAALDHVINPRYD